MDTPNEVTVKIVREDQHGKVYAGVCPECGREVVSRNLRQTSCTCGCQLSLKE